MISRRHLLALPLLAPLVQACQGEKTVAPTKPVANPFEGITDFEGKALPLPQLIGKVSVIDFWASWCAPCRQAFPYLDQLARGFQGDGLQVIGVCVDEKANEGRTFAARYRPSFDIVWDPKGEVKERFLIDGLPTTLLIDARGQLLTRFQGFDLRNHRSLETQVRQLVRGI